jgi:hypothetical protein
VRRALLTAALATCLGIAACGDDDVSSEQASQTPAPQTTASQGPAGGTTPHQAPAGGTTPNETLTGETTPNQAPAGETPPSRMPAGKTTRSRPPATTATTTPAPGASARRTTPRTAASGAGQAGSAVEKARTALEDAGHTVEERTVAAPAVAALSVGEVHVIFFRSAADATKNGDRMAQVFSKFPGRGLVEIKGTRIYWTGRHRPLTSREKAAFRRIVSIAESAL